MANCLLQAKRARSRVHKKNDVTRNLYVDEDEEDWRGLEARFKRSKDGSVLALASAGPCSRVIATNSGGTSSRQRFRQDRIDKWDIKGDKMVSVGLDIHCGACADPVAAAKARISYQGAASCQTPVEARERQRAQCRARGRDTRGIRSIRCIPSRL